ncbi:hypothetical protein [Formosa algae]|uniref:hypothetical protein n=1 Tax=Formosa algae TaxID=225843 RepID=UPI000CCEACC7|nr:hypothetical protein [Formosa algae]PNW24942.1 hypothetical protein BKP44_19860 [Formosa algae]
MIETLQEMNLIAPIIGLIGLIIGSILTFLFSSNLKSKETKLKISEKLIDKRIDAHEQVLKLAKLMRSSHTENQFNSEKELITYPLIFLTEDNYRDWRANYFLVTNEYSHWLSIPVLNELFYIQDYIVNLDKTLENVHEENFKPIGIILKMDFIEMSTNLEKQVIKYFEKGWSNLSIKKKGNYKLPKQESLKRLKESNFTKRYLEISKYFYEKNSSSPRTDIKPITILSNIAPNGMKIDIVKIKEVPNADNSGIEYELYYKDNEFDKKEIRFGSCDLIMGNIRFDKVDDKASYLGITHNAMELLTKWIDENLEPLNYDVDTVEYE